MITDIQQEKIDYIIDNFKFERVLIAMQALDWRWQTTEDNGLKIPTITKLKAAARNLLSKSIKDKCIGSGGFQAEYFAATEKEEEHFTLMFILDYADSTDYND